MQSQGAILVSDLAHHGRAGVQLGLLKRRLRQRSFMERRRRTVLITGASSGIGKSTARLFADEGFRVFGTIVSLERTMTELKCCSSTLGQMSP
jgi:NADPH:quinone reductase-like Zn-dependent oxidoreductase